MENNKNNTNEIALKDLIHAVWVNWYWFALSIAVCLALAVVYLKWSPKTYVRTASVLIKDNAKGGGAISESSAFEELQLFNIKRNVDNEVLVFKTRQMMQSTARRLALDVSYTVKEGLRTRELYTHSPVILKFPEAEAQESFSLTATPVSEKEVTLSGFARGEESWNDKVTAVLNDTTLTPIGKVVVTSTLYYTEKSFGTTIMVHKSDLEQVTLAYSNALKVSLANKSATIINLTLEDQSIARAEDILNTLIAVYNEEAINDKNQIMVNTSDFINERLIIIEEELGNVETNIETYKRENRLTDIHSEAGIYLAESSEYNKEEMELENQKTLAGYIRDYLTDASRNSDLIPANTGIKDMNVEGQISEYNELLLKRDKFISNSSDKNPVIMNLNNSLGAMKQTIIRAIDNLIVGLDIKINNIRERERQTSRRISAVPSQQKHVLSIERQQKIKEELYLYLLNKREENALSQAITESNARILDPAAGSKAPVSPETNTILLAALLFGLAIPAGGLWVQSVLNTSVRNRKDIEDNLSIPFLGEIPLREKKDKSEIVVRENGRDSVSEAFRIVRTNMEFLRVGSDDKKVVMFTSFNVGSGKTFVCTNLAVSIALTHKKVVLVDLDIRKASLSNRLGSKNIGITNYLSGKVRDVKDIINKGDILNLVDTIHAGPIPPNPAELLLSDRLDNLVAGLKKDYDYVILDNVPSGMVADSAIVNRVADLTIYVVRAGMFDRSMLPEVEKLYSQKKLKNMSLILNGINYKHAGYGYGRYGYTYGYEQKK